MLMPKKVKYRKQQRGRMRGKAWRGAELSFGDFGLKARTFWEVRGIDWAFLESAFHRNIHPDYPPLVPLAM